MADPPFFRTSGLDVSPQISGRRTVAADAATGEMLLSDPVAGTLRLAEMRGLRRLPGTTTAGPGGDYARVTDAIAAAVAALDPRVPSPASVTLTPGVIDENIVVPKESWVQLTAIGRVRLQASTPGPVLYVAGGDRATRLEMRSLELDNLGDDPAILVEGGIGGVVLGAQHCLVQSEGSRSPALRVSGLCEATLDGCELRAAAGPAAVEATGSVSLAMTGCSLRGGAAVSTTGKWLLDNSRMDGPGFVELTVETARYWGSRIEGALVVGGRAEIVSSDLARLELEDGAQADASLSKLRSVVDNPNAALNVDKAAGEVSFAGAAAATVLFAVPRMDNNYEVSFTLQDRPAGDEVPWLSAREKEGFEIRFLSPQTLQVSWAVSTL